MAFEDWEKGQDGNIKVFPLAGFETFVPFGMMCGLRALYVENDEQRLAENYLALPLIMQPSQAREIAAALIRCADQAERPPSGETPQ
jgi:hypothetical protein